MHKQALSLAKSFHVFLFIPAPFRRSTWNGINIIGLRRTKQKWMRVLRQIGLIPVLLKTQAMVYHFHDPELILCGIILKKIKQKPVIYDKHENTPFGLIGREGQNSWKYRLIQSAYRSCEKCAIRLLDKIVLAEKSYAKTIQKNTIGIYNYPMLNNMGFMSSSNKKYDAIYVGGVTKQRGLIPMLHIAYFLKQVNPQAKVRIIGPIMDHSDQDMYRTIRDLDISDNFIYSDYMPYRDAMKEVEQSFIGLALLYPDKNYLESIPQKLFEYMSYGIPFIASDFPYWKQLLGRNAPGWFVSVEEYQSIAEIIVQNRENPQFSPHDIQAQLTQKFSWRNEEDKLINLYNELMKKN
ncbi:MAG: glycosyltransferase [Fidelibacterota bacterium]